MNYYAFYTGLPGCLQGKQENDSDKFAQVLKIKNQKIDSECATGYIRIPATLELQIEKMKKEEDLENEADKIYIHKAKFQSQLQKHREYGTKLASKGISREINLLGSDLFSTFEARLTQSGNLTELREDLHACHAVLEMRNKDNFDVLETRVMKQKNRVSGGEKLTGFSMMLQVGCLEVLAFLLTVGTLAIAAESIDGLKKRVEFLCSSGLSIFKHGLESRNQKIPQPNKKLELMAEFMEVTRHLIPD